MKNIKFFKYVNTEKFNKFLDAYDYKPEDVKGFSYYGQEQRNGNVLKEWCIHFNDDERHYFTVVCFKDFNEYHQCRLGFRGEKLLDWWQDADIKFYKKKGW